MEVMTEYVLDPTRSTALQNLSYYSHPHSSASYPQPQSSSSSSSIFSHSHPVSFAAEIVSSSMPGTIHVSVLDFSDLPSTSSSSVLFKVSMGKSEYQTLDKGDFSFTVKSLREKLILVVLDEVGSKLLQTVVEAILIVQKGHWDDYFSFDGGGRVRMRLQFVLSDDDRVKIRKMRESVLQKKRIQLLNAHPELSKAISLDAASVQNKENSVDLLSQRNDGNEAEKTSPVESSVSFFSTQQSAHESKGVPAINEQNDRQRAAEDMIISDAATSRSAKVNTMAVVQSRDSGALNFKPSTFGSKGKLLNPNVDDQDGTLKEERLRKTPSSVRNMISAFECSTTQDTKSRNKPPPLKAQIIKLEFDNPSQDMVADEVVVAEATRKLTEMSSEIVVSPSFFSELRQKVSAKKRQISYDVVEIVTIAPERNSTEVDTVGADELVSEPHENEACVSEDDAVDAVDRFDVMTEDVMASGEDGITVPTFETRDNSESKDMEVENQDKSLFDDNIDFLTAEEDGTDRPEGDLDAKCYDPPQEKMNDETENRISANATLTVTKDDNGGIENDQVAATVYGNSLDDEHSAEQLLFDDTHSDNLISGDRMMEVISENKHPFENPQHVNKESTHYTKLDNTKSLIEWSPSDEPSRSWVYPDESRPSCTAPSIMQLTNSITGSKLEANSNAVKESAHGSRKSRGDSESTGDGNRRGQFGQAIKIGIMVAFGALVFFSRQRNHR